MKYVFIIILVVVLLLLLPKNKENFEAQYRKDFDNINNPPVTIHADDVQQMYLTQRIYPYGNYSPYSVGNYPNVTLMPQAVGCGSRREPCYGGSQQIVNNILPPLNISGENIAPNNLFNKKDMKDYFHPIGVVYKVYGKENDTFPLYISINDDKYEYYVTKDLYDRRFIKVKSPHPPYRKLGTNDWVQLDKEFYRVSVYDDYYPNYFPIGITQ